MWHGQSIDSGEVASRTRIAGIAACGAEARAEASAVAVKSRRQPFRLWHRVEGHHGGKVNAGVADISDFQGGVLGQFLFDGHVPLP
jgi:alkylated DNA nucleotide flippase Atl1